MTAVLVLFIVFIVFFGIAGIAVQLREEKRFAESGIAEIDIMDGITFERYLEVLFCSLGYSVERTQASGDFGADLIIKREGVSTVVQAKRYSKNVGLKAVQEVVGSKRMYFCTGAMVVTNRDYTKQAIELAKTNSVELWNRENLIKAILSSKNRRVKEARCQKCGTTNRVKPFDSRTKR